MRKHFLDPEVASEVGVNAALIYQFIEDACKPNATPWTQFRDGKCWVEFPKRRFQQVFPYMSDNTVYRLLKVLENLEYIEVGHFDTYNPGTKSYSPI